MLLHMVQLPDNNHVKKQDSGYSVELAWLVVAFFFLSFAFQLTVSLMSTCQSGYTNIFHSKEPDDESYDSMFGTDVVTEEQYPQLEQWCSSMLSFNAMRFVEYTFSGSLVLITIAMIAGIVDVELLVCMFLLSAACMMLGMVAEYAMRGKLAIKAVEKNLPAQSLSPLASILTIIRGQLGVVFWISHILAWVCIIVPWYIIYIHYRAWWQQCGVSNTSSKPAAGASAAPAIIVQPQPPDFVKIIVFVQAILFLSFGLVQFVQYFYPHKRRVVEVVYISLSLTAKVLLGAILAANVLLA
jgi:hypothetical protein